MASHRSSPVVGGVLAGLLLLVAAAPAFAGPEDPKPARKGKSFQNAEVGVRARAPDGWRMLVDKFKAPSVWKRLVTFNDILTDAQATLSARPRTASRLEDLLASVRKDWDASRGELRVSSMRKVDATAEVPVGSVVVVATFVRKGRTPKAKPGQPPPTPMPPVPCRVQATYYLAQGYELLLYAVGQQTHWARLRAPLEQLRTSIAFQRKGTGGPKGAGSYRDDRRGFTCKFPTNYTVVAPQRSNHLVQFEGVGANDPTLGVYAFPWDESIERDLDRLTAYYEEEKGGETSLSRTQIGGRETIVLTARADVGGQAQTVIIAIFKRGGECFRLRAAMPRNAESEGRKVFQRFVNGFALGRVQAPK